MKNHMALTLHDVGYTYPHSQRSALLDISCTFPSGATAIVGPNGAGKSTLVKLLAGLLEPTRGSIEVHLPDGTCRSPCRMHKGVLFQEPSHLYLTIRQNITMAFAPLPGEEARIADALEQAGLAGVVRDLPDGIDTLVGAGFGGRVDLSGGQWQRLALARLIYQDAPLLILDEPIASLDPRGEQAVFRLFANRSDKIVIFTTHRYDSIPEDTNILVLVDGRIAESGRHEHLLRRQQDYWSLFMASTRRPPADGTVADVCHVR
jgi:ATP-binding cassette subfamily B protein